ncbi:unnamed protein product [Auanema sp. JU1783]|nr:unnamed protein product [Auanema sp. JU1783]
MPLKDIIEKLIQSSDNEHDKLTNFINGQFVKPSSGTWMSSINPGTGKTWIEIPDSGKDDVELAVNAANTAFKSWSEKPVEERSNLLNKLADLLEENLAGLAILESRDQGKPINLAKFIDIPRCIHNFRFFASSSLHETTPCSFLEKPVRALNYVKRDAVGVAGLISPWNLPLYLLSFKLAPALIAGNTVVCKPSELTSVTAWVLMHAFKEIGFPDGVVNMIIGTGPSAGQHIVEHPDVPLLSFTGSTIVGKKIAAAAAEHNKKVSLEMGGKNSAIVFPSCKLDVHIPTLVRSCFINQGEICLCTSRLYVHDSIYDEFLKMFLTETEKYSVGDPEENMTLGAMNSKQHFEKVKSYVGIAKEEGKVHCGGPVTVPGKCSEGYYISPTVVTDIGDDSRCMNEEIFGPVVCIIKFNDLEEVVNRSNSSSYGLSATVWSEKMDELIETSNKLRVGTVWCNTWLTRDLKMPFGGTKQSGIGREGQEDSLHFFTEAKTVCIRY